MAKIPTQFNTNTTKNIIENGPDVEEPIVRGYLGFSAIGGECVRKIWYGFRFASKRYTSVRMKRIFERGDIEEARVIRELKQHGMEVFRREGDEKIELIGTVGEQQEQLIGFAGHAKGHPDGRVLGVIESPKTEHLLEIKTMNNSRWNAFAKAIEKYGPGQGVKQTNPVYFGQVQRLMRAMKLKRTLFIATNKDNEKREYERIYYDKDVADELERREQDIIVSDQPLGEKFPRSWFLCTQFGKCQHYDVCQNGEAPLKTCRSCEHVDLEEGGKWICTKRNNKELSLEDQLLTQVCKGRDYKRLF